MYVHIIHVRKCTTYWLSHSFIQWTRCAASDSPYSGDQGLHAVQQHPQTPLLCWKRCWFLWTPTRKECNLWGLNRSSEVWGVLSQKEAQHSGEDGAPEPTWWGESLGEPQSGGDSALSAQSAGRRDGGSKMRVAHGLRELFTDTLTAIAQLCPSICDPMCCTLPGSSDHGLLQPRILEWVAIPSSRGSSQPRDWTRVSHTAGDHLSFPGGSDGKEYDSNAGDSGSISRLGRSPVEGNGNPLQYSCLEKSMVRGAWWATVHGVTKESDTT